MSIAGSISGVGALWTKGGRLALNPLDRVKYALSYYLNRRALLAAMAPQHFVVHLSGGIRAPIRPNGVDFKTLADIFDHQFYNVSETHTAKRILDLGANIGMATLYFAGRFPKAELACVEPSPGNRVILRETIRLNAIRATVFDGAVGTDSGEFDLDVGAQPDMFSLTPAHSSTQKLRVRLFTVPEMLATLGWDEIDLLKIDIEGYEKTLFRENNSWLSRVRLIIGEAHGHVGYGVDEVRADLEPLGFEVIEKSYDPRWGLTIFEARNKSL